MTVMNNYPGNWQGVIPEEIKTVSGGKGDLTVNLSVCLPYMEHLTCPVFKPLENLQVLDPACGTGEVLLLMALKYPQTSFTACDISPEALAQAQRYVNELELNNIQFIDSLPEAGEYDFIMPTRPLQQIEDPSGFLARLHKNLREQGALRIQIEAGNQTGDRLCLQEKVEAMKAGQLSYEEAMDLVSALLAQPLKDHIDGLRECNQTLQEAGFKFWSGLHPRSYEPGRYLQTMNDTYFNGLQAIDKAYLAEQFCGQMQMYSLLYTHRAYDPLMPSFYDSQSSKYIPHLSPYVGASKQEDRFTIGLKHQHLLLEAGIEFEDLNIPEELFGILLAIDGKINCEQIHRRFLPMPWTRFWALIQACWEEEIIFLHRPGTV
ncbi:MAG: class I SAM-dependent methyltransferase [Syntrophomonadaceae bacterium]|nr:class I SAM-dependent methyltransferase [Syntrophomonadaceae bacterium]